MRSGLFATLQLFAVAAFQAGSYAQTVTPGGVVNNAGFQAPVAPGSLIAIFGDNLAAAPAAASTLPLPTTLGGVSVTVNGTLAAPLIYVSDKQINAQLPYETSVGSATLSVNGSAPVSFSVVASAPGILTYGANRAVAINQDGSLNSSDHPAQAGSWVTVYMSGQGLVSPAVVSGAASPGNPVAQPMLAVVATIGKQSAGIMFAGLTPGAVGLFQVNLRIPALASGDFPLMVSVGQGQSNTPLISVSADGNPVPSIVRTVAYHQVSNLPDQGPDGRTSFAISGFGGVIAFTHDTGPNQIYVMNFDGTGQTLVDSYPAFCACGSYVDISDKGDKVVSTEGRQIRLVDKGVLPLLTIDSSTAGIAGLKIEGDGGRIFFLVDRDAMIVGGPQSTGIQRGLYMMPVDGSGLMQIVGPDAVAALFGSTASNYYTPGFSDSGNTPNHTLGVSADGTRIVFGAQQVSGGGPDAIFGVNGDGSGLHMILGPVPYVDHVGISADGSKVLYDITSSDFVVETGVIDFDGTNRLALRHDGLGETPGVQLSADGSLLLAYNILYNTDGSGALQLSTLLNDLTPGQPVMDVTATRFVYPFVVPGTYSQGLSQLATAEIDPTSLGAAPAISSPTINPDYAVAGGAVQGTVTAGVNTGTSPHDHVLGVNYALVRDGLVEDPVNGVIFLVDDGTSGDQVAGDGIFTLNNVIAQANAPEGPRLFRLFAEVTDAAGLRHGTLIDITPFSVVLQPPASGTTGTSGH
jgi:uncharacterized protein (TIGR03437 family)